MGPHGRTLDHKDVRGTTRTYATFWNTLWIISGCTMHHLDHCTNNTRCTLRLADVCCFFRELVATFPCKYPSTLLVLPSNCEFEGVLWGGAHGFAWFWGNPWLTCLFALFHFLIYVLMSFPKSLLIISLKMLMFSKGASLQVRLTITVSCICYNRIYQCWRNRSNV